MIKHLAVAMLAVCFSPRAAAQDCTYTLAHSRPGALAVFRNGVMLDRSEYTQTGSLGRTVTLNTWSDGDRMTYSYPFAADTVLPGTSPPSNILIWIGTLEYRTCTGSQNPPPPTAQVSRQQCTSTATAETNCAGVELWTVIGPAGQIRQFAAVEASAALFSIPGCPPPPAGTWDHCLQPAALTDPPLSLVPPAGPPALAYLPAPGFPPAWSILDFAVPILFPMDFLCPNRASGCFRIGP